MLTGGFPSERFISQAIAEGQFKHIGWPFWFYVGLMLLTAVVALIFQVRDRRKNLEKYAYKEKFEAIRYMDFKSMRQQLESQKMMEQKVRRMAELSLDLSSEVEREPNSGGEEDSHQLLVKTE